MARKLVLLLMALLLAGAGAAAAQERSHIVQRGETLTRIARQYGVTVEAILVRNNLVNPNRLFTGQVLVIPFNVPVVPGAPATLPGATTTHIVQRGETLNTIAARYGLASWRQIGAFNNLQTPNLIFAGQVLQIPPASFMPPATYLPDLSAGQGGGAAQATLTYIVRPGDTLDSIARSFNTLAAFIIQANNLVSTTLIPGQVLLIPLNAAPPPVVVPPIATLPPAFAPPVAPLVPLPPITTRHYVVQPGDTMIQIARRANRSPWAIAAANGIFNLNRIFVGQVLRIP